MDKKPDRFRVIDNESSPEGASPEGVSDSSLGRGKLSRTRIAFHLRRISVLRLLPSLLTLTAMYCGFTSLILSMGGRFELVVGLIFLAAVLDGIDGRVARLVKNESRFGAELDSFADFLNFGIAPAFALWMWGLRDLGNIGWVMAFFFAVCCALRLARFNVALESDEESDVANKKFFIGVPAPAGGLLVLTPIILSFEGLENPWLLKPILIITVIGIGLLMVSHIRTYSMKTVRLGLPRHYFVSILLVAVVVGVLIFNYPFIALLLLGLGYMLSIPFSALSHRFRSVPGRKV